VLQLTKQIGEHRDRVPQRPTQKSGVEIIEENPLRGAFEIGVLAVAQRPAKRDEPDQSKAD
jgi:hypothetical protein